MEEIASTSFISPSVPWRGSAAYSRISARGGLKLRSGAILPLRVNNEVRTHLWLGKDGPVPRAVQRVGQVTAMSLPGICMITFGSSSRNDRLTAVDRGLTTIGDDNMILFEC